MGTPERGLAGKGRGNALPSHHHFESDRAAVPGFECGLRGQCKFKCCGRLDKYIDKRLDESRDQSHIVGMEFDWDPKKQADLIGRRGIDFVDVLVGFADPDRKVVEDKRKDYGEVRYHMLAKVEGRIFNIIYTVRGPVTWIITAWKANKREQRRYEKP